ncbi:hypothetical protein GQ600_473 [Phytophthora cactorum]|nr:hypothetical protein GQ600_473 [Phytophthora cactorum]
MARAGMKPARIRTSMLLDFDLRPSELPALQKVQNVVCYYRRTKLGVVTRLPPSWQQSRG